jgi:hypothetical protein
MSIKIQINEDPNFSYSQEAESYQILDTENKVTTNLKDNEIYELKDNQRLICWFSETLSYENYVKSDNPLSKAEQLLIDKNKNETLINVYRNSVEQYFIDNEITEDQLLDFIDTLSHEDLKLNGNTYKINSNKLKNVNSKDLEILFKIKCTDEEVKDAQAENLFYFTDDLKLELKLGFIYSAKAIKDKMEYFANKKSNEECIYSETNVVREIDGQLIKMKGDFGIAFMNLCNALSVEINDDICSIHCSAEEG